MEGGSQFLQGLARERGRACSTHDCAPEQTWRHLDMMQFTTLTRARASRADPPRARSQDGVGAVGGGAGRSSNRRSPWERSPQATAQPLSRNRQKSGFDTPIAVWQDSPRMTGTQNQLSLTSQASINRRPGKKQVRDRLQLLKTRLWPMAELASWLGINFPPSPPLLAQYQMWNQMWNQMSHDAASDTPAGVDRWRFEIFLNSRNWIPRRPAALELAVSERSFAEVMAAAKAENFATRSEADGVFPGIYSSDFISGFHRRFPQLQNRTFPDINEFYAQLHDQIFQHLGVTPIPLKCLTAEVLGEDNYAASLDAITEEPMSMPFQVFLETGKPSQLRPDSCSWLTYFRFETILKPALLGRPPDLTRTQLARLQQYADSR